MRTGVMVVFGVCAVLVLAACGSDEDVAATTTLGTTATSDPIQTIITSPEKKDPIVTNPTLAPKFDVVVSASQVSGGAKFTVNNTGDLSLVSGVVTIKLSGASSGQVQGGEQCSGEGTLRCSIDSFEPGDKIVVDVELDGAGGSDSTTTTKRLMATVTVVGELADGKNVSTPAMQVEVR